MFLRPFFSIEHSDVDVTRRQSIEHTLENLLIRLSIRVETSQMAIARFEFLKEETLHYRFPIPVTFGDRNNNCWAISGDRTTANDDYD